MDRFDVKNGVIIDYSEKELLNIGKVCDLLNQLNDFCNQSSNEIARIEEGLIDLDILIGTLSWYVDERSDYTLKDINDISLRLSKCINGIMYPKFEDIYRLGDS
jgi:hypothetical protein